MTVKEYEELKTAIFVDRNNAIWHWEMLKALWDIAKAIRTGLE